MRKCRAIHEIRGKRGQGSLVVSRVLARRDCGSRNFARKRIEPDGPFKFKNLTIDSVQVSFLYARLYMLYTRGEFLLGRSKNSVSRGIEFYRELFRGNSKIFDRELIKVVIFV